MRGVPRALALLLAGALVALAVDAALAGESPRWLEDRVQAYLLEHAPEGPISIEIPPLDEFTSAGGDPDAVEVAITTDAKRPLSGAVPLTIVLSRDGSELERRIVTAQVASAELGVVASRALSRGDVLTADHLTLAPIANPIDRRSGVSAIDDALGKRLRRNVASGAPVRNAWLEDVPLVKRGEPVRLAVLRGRLRIESTGIARQDGKVGQIVRVENPSSHREILGRVGEDGVVHVSF